MNRVSELCLSPYDVEKALSPDGWGHGLPREKQHHADACERCRAVLVRAREEDDHYRSEMAGELLRLVQKRAPARATERRRVRTWCLVAVAAAVVLVLLLFLPRLLEETGRQQPGAIPPVAKLGQQEEAKGPYVGTKASVGLAVYVWRGEKARRLLPGEVLHPGDSIRLLPSAEGQRFLLVLVHDTMGEIQVVHPLNGRRSVPLPLPGEPVAGALELDEQTGTEMLVALYTKEPLAAADAMAWAVEHSDRLQDGQTMVSGETAYVAVVSYTKEAQ